LGSLESQYRKGGVQSVQSAGGQSRPLIKQGGKKKPACWFVLEAGKIPLLTMGGAAKGKTTRRFIEGGEGIVRT